MSKESIGSYTEKDLNFTAAIEYNLKRSRKSRQTRQLRRVLLYAHTLVRKKGKMMPKVDKLQKLANYFVEETDYFLESSA